MFKRTKKWITKLYTGVDEDQLRLQRIEQRINELQEQNTKLKEEKEQVASELEEYKFEEQLVESKRNGTEPWVEITSANYDEVRGFRIELDWNEAFIQHLKESGIKGKSDEEVVQKWVGFLYGDLIEKLERTAIDKAGSKPTNDFI